MGSKIANTRNHKKKKKEEEEEVISDPRFSRVHRDPRFREARKHERKVSIDSRFNRMFTHKSFLPCSAPVDKRGKPKPNDNPTHTLCRHYFIEEEEEKENEEDAIDTSESESAIDTDTDDGVDDKIYAPDIVLKEEEVTNIKEETHRLAVVNINWRHVKAVQLYKVFSSFVPKSNGLIKSVAVYPTEFGLQRMKEEEVRGPVALFHDENEKSDDDDDDDVHNEKLHAYEMSRMRYYHAMVECDSIITAKHIYKQIDGYELPNSLNPLDLRFIPDDMEFKHPPRDIATEAPANYDDEDINFFSQTLRRSKVDLTGDEDEPLFAETLKQKFNDEQLTRLKLEEFFASDVRDSDDGENNNETDDQPDKMSRKLDKYCALLRSGNGSDEDAEHDEVQDMEVTFNTNLEYMNRYIMEKKDKNSETVWEACMRKRREKKKARKNKSKHSSDVDTHDTDQEATEEADDFFIEEHPLKKRKKAQRKNDNDHDHKFQDVDGLDKASKEELELLLADDKGTDTGLKGYHLKLKKVKGKKRENGIAEAKIPNAAHDDPRFAALFSANYAIDPTDPQFKRSATYARQLAWKQQKGHMELSAESEHTKLPKGLKLSSVDSGMIMQTGEEGLDVLKSKKDKYELSSMIKLIRMKAKQVQLSSYGKTTKDGKSQFKGGKGC